MRILPILMIRKNCNLNKKRLDHSTTPESVREPLDLFFLDGGRVGWDVLSTIIADVNGLPASWLM